MGNRSYLGWIGVLGGGGLLGLGFLLIEVSMHVLRVDWGFGWKGLVGFGVLLLDISAIYAILDPSFWSGIGKLMYRVHTFLSDHDDCTLKMMLIDKIASADGTTADVLEASPHDANGECEIEA
jgi:hypothetical protein